MKSYPRVTFAMAGLVVGLGISTLCFNNLSDMDNAANLKAKDDYKKIALDQSETIRKQSETIKYQSNVIDKQDKAVQTATEAIKAQSAHMAVEHDALLGFWQRCQPR